MEELVFSHDVANGYLVGISLEIIDDDLLKDDKKRKGMVTDIVRFVNKWDLVIEEGYYLTDKYCDYLFLLFSFPKKVSEELLEDYFSIRKKWDNKARVSYDLEKMQKGDLNKIGEIILFYGIPSYLDLHKFFYENDIYPIDADYSLLKKIERKLKKVIENV